MQTPEQRFQTDPHFHALVQAMYDYIAQAQFSPSEIREAAMLATIQYEMNHVRPIFISEDDYRKL